MIYFDNAATSWPKPPCMLEAMARFQNEIGANPGRSGHRLAVEAARVIYEVREAVAELVHAPDPLRVVFGANATEALNLAMTVLRPGDHVITSSMEHNSVMRPLRAWACNGVDITVVPCSPRGELDPADVKAAIGPATRMIVLTHASNVTGSVMPIGEVGRIAREHDALLLVDAAQTAGAYPIDMEADAIDLLAFSGHKSLYGPMGTGGLVISDRVELRRFVPLKRGGTGSRSEHEEQPGFLPDLCESGTPNAIGLAGLAASVRWVLSRGVESIRSHEMALTDQLLGGLEASPGVRIYGPCDPSRQTATISFTIAAVETSDIGFRLDEDHGIMCRVGLHCAPSAHRTLGTFPRGTVRFGLGVFNTTGEVEAALDAIAAVARSL